MPKDDTGRVTESASRAFKVAVRQELRRLEEEVAALIRGQPGATDAHKYGLLGRLPEYLRLLARRERELRSQLDVHRRSEPTLRESVKELQSLTELSRQINSTLEVDEILKLLVELTAGIVDTEGSIVYLYDEGTEAYEKAITHRIGDEALRAIQFTLDSGVLEHLTPESVPSIVPEIAMAMSSGGQERSLIVVPLHHRDRRIGLLVMLSAQPSLSFFQPDLDLLGLLANSVSVAMSNAILFEETKRLAITDDLTRLANSRHLNDFLDRAIREADRDGGRVSLLFTDLDGFKQINDTYGHRMGSALLVEVANIVRRCVGPEDLVARFGGDEFVVVMPGMEAFKAFLVGEEVRAAVGRHVFLREFGLRARLTISVGVATYPDHADSAADLVGRADTAMYVVKNANKDGVSLAVAQSA